MALEISKKDKVRSDFESFILYFFKSYNSSSIYLVPSQKPGRKKENLSSGLRG